MELKCVTSHIASEFTKVIKPGHRIRAQGTRKSQSALFEPEVIQNMTTEGFFRTPLRVDVPIPDQENRLSMTDMKASGTIQVLLYDYMNEAVRGLLLSDGTQVRLPPDVTDELRRSLQVGQSVEAEGTGPKMTTDGLGGLAARISPRQIETFRYHRQKLE